MESFDELLASLEDKDPEFDVCLKCNLAKPCECMEPR